VAWRLTLPPPRHTRLQDFRVAVLPAIAWVPVDAEISAAQEALVSRLGQAGVAVQVVQPDGFGDFRAHHVLYRSLLAAITGARSPEPERQRRAELLQMLDDEFSAANRRGLMATVGDYFLWYGQREQYRAAYRAFFRDWDVLLAPIIIQPAFPHTPFAWPPDAASMQHTITVDGHTVPYDLQLVYPGLATLAGQPATAFPVGLTRAGLPIGLQVLGPYLEDRTPIRFAALVEREFGGFQAPPGYDTR
jgi:amidase